MNSSTGSKWNLFGFNYTDNVDYGDIADLGWKSTGFGTNFVLVPTGSTVLIDGNFAYSGYKITLEEADGRERFSDIGGFNAGLNFSYFFGKDEMIYGIEMLGFKTDYQFTNIYGASAGQTENTTELAAFLKYKKIIGKLIIEPGLRGNYYSSLAEFTLEPRLGAKYNVTDKFRLKAAGGFYSQNFLAASSDRDVVNLFYGFLSGSDNLPEEFDGEKVDSKLQKAQHAIAGFELDLPFHLNLNVEGYFKDFTQLQNINRDKIYTDDAQHSEKPDYQKKEFIIESGTARGVDVVLKYDHKKLYFWAVYSLGYSKRYDGQRTYEPGFDRRHNINLVSALKFGKGGKWLISGRFNFGSAFPFTQTQSNFEQINFVDGLATDFLNQNGSLGIQYGELNKGRLSTFHRLDLSLQRTINLSKNAILEITGGLTNVYDRKNIFYVNNVTREKVYQLPILPSFGIALSF